VLCISYGAEGTMLNYLLRGTPQLVLPWHVEAFMAGRAFESAGLGRSLEFPPAAEEAIHAIETLASDSALRERAARFAVAKAVSHEPLRQIIDALWGESSTAVPTSLHQSATFAGGEPCALA
jgi:UDP:flavonoid glycosyltransferase YjiC (YdhE family)